MPYRTSLEKLREQIGNKELISRFERAVLYNKTGAVNLINDLGLSFSTFFILFPVVKKYNIFSYLNLRNKIAYKICVEFFSDKKINLSFSEMNEINVLKWMINSASYDDGIDDEYDRLIDYAVARLIDEYNEEGVLDTAVSLVFLRNYKNSFNHDLIWAIFKSKNPNVLKSIARFLSSTDERDSFLAKELLENAISDLMDNDYNDVNTIIEENSPYLKFTGNGYNYSNSPHFCEIDTKSQYLGKPVVSHNLGFEMPMSSVEKDNMDKFNQLDYKTQLKLGKLSTNFQKSNWQEWNKWKNSSIEAQLALLNKAMEV